MVECRVIYPIDETHGVVHYSAGPKWGLKHAQAVPFHINEYGWMTTMDSILTVEDARILDAIQSEAEELKERHGKAHH